MAIQSLWRLLLATTLALWAHTAAAQVSYLIGSPADAAAEKEILAAMQKPIRVDFYQTPLDQAIDQLGGQCGLDIVFDRRGLNDIGVGTDSPVRLRASGVTMQSALNLVLEQFELDWTIRHKVLLVSSKEKIERHLMTRVYPVGDLVYTDVGDEIIVDYDSVIDAITATVAPETWDDVGGPGSVQPFPASKALLISQTLDIHSKIENVLIALRKARRVQGVKPVIEEPAPITMSSPRFNDAPNATATARHAGPAQAWQTPRVHD